MKASKYFLGALGAASTTGAVVGIGAGIVGLLGGGPLAGVLLGATCGFGAMVGVLGVATLLFPVVKLCSYIDEKTNFFTKAGEIISSPFKKFGNWIKEKSESSNIELSPNPSQDEQSNTARSPDNTVILDINASPRSPSPPSRLSYTAESSRGSESPPPPYHSIRKHEIGGRGGDSS